MNLFDYTKSQCLDFTTYNYETSQHKPLAYGVMAGNFDGAGGSFGTCQFNWKTGDLQPIFQDLLTNHTADVQAAFTLTADYNTFVNVVQNMTTAQQIAWGDSITNQGNKNTVIEPWNTYFKTLGTFASCQAAQETATQPYYNTANTWASDFGLWTRRGYALCLDMSIQAGGMTALCHSDIMDFVAAQKLMPNMTPELQELYVMAYFAYRRSNDVSSSFQQSFRDRKNAIAFGSGTVYGGNVDTVPYDLILEPNGFLAAPASKTAKWVHLGMSL